ncbi:unnamed protein product [Jaminaea pallidilutea]
MSAKIQHALAGVLPLLLLAFFAFTALVPAWSRESWSQLLPPWITIFAHDVIGQDDIAELDQEEEKHRQRQEAQLDAKGQAEQRNGHRGAHDGDGNVDEATEATPLIRKPSDEHLLPPSKVARANLPLSAVALLQIAISISSTAYHLERPDLNYDRLVAASTILTRLYELWRPLTSTITTPPYDLMALYIVQLLTQIISAYDSWNAKNTSSATTTLFLLPLFSGTLSLLALFTIVRLPLSSRPRGDSRTAAEDHCTLWQWMTFSWLSPLITIAVQRTLEPNDIWQISKSCRSSLLLRKFKSVKASTLPRKILRANSHDILLDISLTLVSAVLSYASPFFLKRILEAIQNSSSPHPSPWATSKQTAYLYALFSLVADMLKSQADLQHLYFGRRACIRIRGQLIASIYEKALRTRDMNGVVPDQDEGKAKKSKGQDGVAASSKEEDKGKKPKAEDPSNASSSASVGKIVSLAAVDSIRISAQAASAYMLYSAPIEFVVASLFLYQLLGLSAFAGFLVLLVASPLQSMLTRRMIAVSKKLSAARDQRLNALNEVTLNLHFIKYYAMENEMKQRVMALREKELSWLRRRQWQQASIMLLWSITPAAVTTVSFAFYVLVAKRDLDVSTAFTSIALFQLLRGPLNALPMQVNELLNAKVASDRIDEFLQATEVAQEVSSLKGEAVDADEARSLSARVPNQPIGCDNASFGWPLPPVSDLMGHKSSGPSMLRRALDRVLPRSRPNSEANTPLLHGQQDGDHDEDEDDHAQPFRLTGITFTPPAGKLCLVTGPTGSGKTALLSALLGEMELLSGKSHMTKDPRIDPRTGLSQTIAYCAQLPWLQHASIRANILFGAPLEQVRYDAVLDACALRPDLEILDGDGTEIGEKGVSLSGGQQARVALARAVYSRSQTLLLDDPLSAVDSHTAAKLVKDCLSGPLMKGRTVVLVTHQLRMAMGVAEWIVQVSEGKIVAQGTPETMKGLVGGSEQKGEEEEDDAVEGDEKAQAAQQQQQSQPEGDDANATPARPRRLVEEETRARGGVKREVYKMYLAAVGHVVAALVIATLITYKGTDLLEKYWLAVWGASYSQETQSEPGSTASAAIFPAHMGWSHGAFTPSLAQPLHRHLLSDFSQQRNAATVSSNFSAQTLPPAHDAPTPYILTFFAIQLSSAALIVLAALITFHGSLKASRSLFVRMLTATMGATSRWLDKTPSGRIVNKFSRDIEVVDASINQSLRYFITFLIAGVISVITIIVVLPTFIFPTIVLGAANLYVARGYIRAARDLRRLESVSRSPIFSAFSELLQGIATVRSFAAESRMLRECTERIDLANGFFLYFWMANRWLLFRLDILGSTAIFVATVAALRGSISAGFAGVALTQAQSIVQAGYWMARMYTTLEQDANSIERVREALDETPQEPAAIVEDNRPPDKWPAQGRVQVKDLSLRYAPDLPPVLHGISFDARPGEKIGIVGRTGSGKSTTALAFFRFVERFDSGSIVIDDVNISTIGLYDLRSRLTIIPQNAVLFSGTVRDNLDPHKTHSDEECIKALHSVHIRTTPNSGATSAAASDDGAEEEEQHPTSTSQTYITLSTPVSEGGTNFSLGQRQLLAMARALLRRSKVIIMDEASSAVDFGTDALIQSTIRKGFEHATVITIAHRLVTVARADRVLVLDRGRVVEFASPQELMKEGAGKGVFRSMCLRSGDWELLQKEAEEGEREREQRRSSTAALTQ